MKRIYLVLVGLFLLFAGLSLSFQTSAQKSERRLAADAAVASPNIVISQFQTGGDGAGTFNDEFIELHNTSADNFDLNGFRLVYRSAGGINDVAFVNWTSSTIIPPGGYYLIASTSYNGSTAPNAVYNPTACQCSMSGNGGGLAIRSGALDSGIIFDSVGWGTATNVFIEGTKTAAPPANASQARLNEGCQDTDNNISDFTTVNPSLPRNSASAPNVCGGTGGATLLAGGGASPSTVVPGGSTLLTVSVFPATNPPSTGITVTGNLTEIGGAASQPFYDDGTNGDATPNDNVFSFLATIPVGLGGGNATVTAVAADAELRNANVSIPIVINAAPENDDPLLLGNPTGATPDPANENNYLMPKPQYTLSYNRSRSSANWVAWRLDSSWIGSSGRNDSFRPDDTLPAGWYRVTPEDYTNPAYDRGHMTPSGDRTRTVVDNEATFLMTNILPQLDQNNQGPWADFENYCRSLAQTGNEIYIVSGGAGNIGTLAQGRLVVPEYTWKVALILGNGNNDLSRITKRTRTIGLIVPNFPPVNISSPWRNYRVTVNQVEALTGYNFFSNIAPARFQETIESRLDTK